jgi:hypothetical protein
LLTVISSDGAKPKKTYKACFAHVKTTKNPRYLKGIHPLKKPKAPTPFESCLLYDKSATFERVKDHKNKEIDSKKGLNENTKPTKTVKKPLLQRSLAIAKEPKWLKLLQYIEIDSETGECLGLNTLETDSFKASNASKIRAMDVFCGAYNELYRKKRVTLLFHTFTRAEASNRTWSDFLQLLLKRYKRIGSPVLGFVWVLEVGKRGMIHYHLAVAINRRQFKTIPVQLKLEDVWGSRTEIDFVKKNVRHYLAKYFAKNRHRVLDLETSRTLRSLGKSKTFKTPYLYSEN